MFNRAAMVETVADLAAENQRLRSAGRPDLTWPTGQPFDPARAFQLADDLRQLEEFFGHCRIGDGADMIEHLLTRLGFARPMPGGS